MRKHISRSVLLAGVAAVAALACRSASAADATDNTTSTTQNAQSTGAVEEVVVTARRRNEDLQKTPVSETVVDAATLAARNVVTLEKIGDFTPNLRIYPVTGTIGSAAAFIRGIGYTDNVVGQDSPIGYYVDGIVVARPSTALMELVQPDQVEVLRGPQGTLFGRNTTAGAIVITTHTPSDDFGGMAKVSYGTFQNIGYQGRIDTGLLGDSGIKASFAFQHTQQNGTSNNLSQPSDLDFGAQRTDAYWLKVMGNWGRLSATFTGDYTETSGVPDRTQIVAVTPATATMFGLSPGYGGGSYDVTSKPQFTFPNDATGGLQHFWNGGVGATLVYDVSDALSFKLLSGVRGYGQNNPVAYGPADLAVNVGSVATPNIVMFNGADAYTARRQSEHEWSEELQMLGTIGDFDYVAGLYYFKESAMDLGYSALPYPSAGTGGATASNVQSARVYTVDSKSEAAYAQVDWKPSALDRKLELSGGLRWTHDSRDFSQTQPLDRGANLGTNNTSYLTSLTYQWTPTFMTYARISSGYRAGGFNARAANNAPLVLLLFQPETITSYEVGFKTEFFDRRLRLNGSLFDNKYNNLQTAQFAPPGATSGGGAIATNTDATYKGFELEVDAVPTDNLTLSGEIGYVSTEYSRFPTGLQSGAVSPGCTAISYNGSVYAQDCHAIASTIGLPDLTAGATVRYDFPATDMGQPSVQLNYSYRSSTEWGTFDLPSTPFKSAVHGSPYGLLSGRIALSDIPVGSNHAEIALYGDNLTDEKYVVQAIDWGFMATENFGRRRTIGIEATVDF